MGDLRCGAERTFLRLGPDGCESIGDHSDKEVDEPEIKYDDGQDKKDARDEELRVNHVVHHRCPLKFLVKHLLRINDQRHTPLALATTITCNAE